MFYADKDVALDVQLRRTVYLPMLLQNALSWYRLGQSREGWVRWAVDAHHDGAPGPVGQAVRQCYAAVGGIAMLVWGPACRG